MKPDSETKQELQKHTAVNIFLSRAYDLILSWPVPETAVSESSLNKEELHLSVKEKGQ